jgi:hypothetical protein
MAAWEVGNAEARSSSRGRHKFRGLNETPILEIRHNCGQSEINLI